MWTKEEIVSLLDVIWQNDIEECLFYRVDKGEPSFYIICNDVFDWGTADLEEITPNDLHKLVKAIDDVTAAVNAELPITGALLYCARQRNKRPQGAYYAHMDSEVWPLFNQAGPARELNMVNPKPQPDENG